MHFWIVLLGLFTDNRRTYKSRDCILGHSPSIEHMSLMAFLASLPTNVTQKWDNYDDPVDTNKVDLDISQDQISCLIRPHISNPDKIDGSLTGVMPPAWEAQGP